MEGWPAQQEGKAGTKAGKWGRARLSPNAEDWERAKERSGKPTVREACKTGGGLCSHFLIFSLPRCGPLSRRGCQTPTDFLSLLPARYGGDSPSPSTLAFGSWVLKAPTPSAGSPGRSCWEHFSTEKRATLSSHVGTPQTEKEREKGMPG